MFGIRKKLLLGQGITLAIIAAIGFMVMSQINRLGAAIDVILKENYSSVRASLEMSESIDNSDRNILYYISGLSGADKYAVRQSFENFKKALKTEEAILTLPGEKETASKIRKLFSDYEETAGLIKNASPEGKKAELYFQILMPLSEKIRSLADEILIMNQNNMNDANNAAREMAEKAYNTLLMAIVSAAAFLVILGILITKWVLRPVDMLIDSAREIRGGNLDLVINNENKDEIGKLSETFNEMAAALREARQSDRLNLMRTKRTTEEVFKALPVVVAALDNEGNVEFATEKAAEYFGLSKGKSVKDSLLPDMYGKVRDAALNDKPFHSRENADIQKFINGEEHFFSPSAVPIEDEKGETFGVALILDDVTRLREMKELKQSVVATVSHQLRTPLTSLRMSVHLLLNETTGPVNEKQEELLITARDDSERLAGIIDDLLDINRMESGKTLIKTAPVNPRALAGEELEAVSAEARDAGITLKNSVPDDLPEAEADVNKITHVFANILANALRFTQPGGEIEIKGEEKDGFVWFHISDTGTGIEKKDLPRIFDLFYRSEGQSEKSGVGLGLAIAREIVSAHGGEIKASSEPGAGSVFSFSLKKANL